MFSFRQWKNQLRLIDGCYSGRTGVVSELLTGGAPDEINPLFTFKTVGVPHHPHALLEARALGVAVAQLKEAIWDCWKLLREWGCHRVSSVHHSVILFRPLQMRSLKCFSLRRVLTAVQFGDTCDPGWELRQTGSKCHGCLSGVLFWRCALMIGSLSHRVLTGLRSPVRSWKEK